MRKVIVALLVFLLVLTACGDSSSEPTSTPGQTPTATPLKPTTKPPTDTPAPTPTKTSVIPTEKTPTNVPEHTPTEKVPVPVTETPTPEGNAPPVAVIEEVTPNPAFKGDEITFRGTGSDPDGDIAAYHWSIDGHGAIAYKASFISSIAADEVGDHTVIFKVKDSDGVWSPEVKRAFQVLLRPPSASFSASPACGDNPLKVQFSAFSGDDSSWSWDFGDGSTSTDQNPLHTYTAVGTYTVSLTVKGPGGSSNKTNVDYIEVLDIEFIGTPVSGQKPLTVQFTDQSVGAIASWMWSFGDGETSSEQHPTHTYNAAGKYVVSLTVKGSCGLGSTKSMTDYIQVLEPPPAADFYSHTETLVGHAERFTDYSTGSITAWTWNFGDGSTSNAQSPTHTYNTAGTYTVSLTVTGPGGTDTHQRTITVEVRG